jgi:Ca2+-binding EF-hand superfamily protein
MKYILRIIVGVAAILSITASAQSDVDPFLYADSNGDGTLSRDEYGVAWKRLRAFDYWDSDQDGLIETEEYTSGVRERYDYDRSQNLSRAEWERATPWSEGFGAYENYDINADDSIDEEEWNRGVENFAYDRAFDNDEDESLNEDEYMDMTYDSSDMDGDGKITFEEFEQSRKHWASD